MLAARHDDDDDDDDDKENELSNDLSERVKLSAKF